MLALRKKLIFIVCLTLSFLVIYMRKIVPLFVGFKCLKSNTTKLETRDTRYIPSHIVQHSKPSFIQTLDTFPWANFALAINHTDQEQIWNYVGDLVLRLTPYIIKEPKISINQSCISPPLRVRTQLKCKNETAEYPKKIGILLQLGFEVDILEIHLNELFDVVDKFFIIESTFTHSKFYAKPLIWERVKYQERFRKFLSKIVHFVVDDAQAVSTKVKVKDSMVNFEAEWLQERLRWKKFLAWNNATSFFNETDLLGFGDCDEIASRETVNYLKHCVPESDPIDVGIWFPFGAIDQAFLTDFPLDEHPFTLGDPTFWTLKTAMDIKILTHFNLPGYPTRNRGNSEGHVLGGIHMSHYGYLPSLLIKRLTQSESSYDYLKQVAEFPQHVKNKSWKELHKFYSEDYYKNVKFRIFALERVKQIDAEKEDFVVLPWFYNCNRGRYPAWERKPDPRLD